MSWTLSPLSGEAFAAHAERWRALNAQTLASPLLEPEFVAPLLTEFGTGREWLASYERDGQLQAMAVLQQRRRGVWQSFQPSQQPLALWLGRADLPLPALLDALRAVLPGFPLALGLTQCDPWLTPQPADDARLSTAKYIDTSRITLSGSFDDYWAGRGKNLRSNMKKQRAKLAKDGIVARLQVSRDADDMVAALADYGRLESAGWKAGQGTAIHPDNAQGRFYRSMLENFCRRGQASVLRYWFGERLVAMNLCIEGSGGLIILKTTYDESLSSQYSPAFLMLEETCQQLFAGGRFQRLEFYGKVMEWHLRWTDEVRSMYHVTSYRWAALLRLRTLVKHRRALLAGLRPQAPAPALPARHSEPSTE